MTLVSAIACPHCPAAKSETMPTDACRFFYECTVCGARLRPQKGDCCVFCSHGSVPCPPMQSERSGEAGAASCWRHCCELIRPDTYPSGYLDHRSYLDGCSVHLN